MAKSGVVTKDRWSLRNIYLYLVCLITLIMVIVAAVGVVRGIVEFAYPDPGYVSTEPIPVGEDKQPLYTQEEWEKMKAEEQARMEASTRRYAVLSLVGNAAMLFIAGPLYIYHWRKIEVEHAEATTLPAPTTEV